MMMNILALFLVLSSIGAGVLSPNPEKKNSREDMIVKEAHQVVFIEYEREIQPNKKENERVEANETPITEFQNPFEMEQRGFQSVSSLVGNANEKKMREAFSVLPNLGQGISGKSLISKACEMSKQVVDEEGLNKAKDLASYKADHLVEEGAMSAVVETGKKIEEGYEQKATEKTHDFKEAFEDAKESATESFKKIPQRLAEKAQWEKEAIEDAKDKILKETQDLSEGIGYVKGKWKVLDKAYDVKEAAEETATDASEGIGGAISKAEESVLEKTSTVEEEAIEETAAETRKKVSEGFDQAKEKVIMNRMPETIGKESEQVSEKAHEFKEAMKETAALAAPHEEVSEGLFSKSKEKVLEKAHELEANSKETIEKATERAKRFLGDLKHLYNMLETALTDNRTAKVKTTHFFIEGSHNFTTLFTRSFLSVYHTSDETVNWTVGVLRLMGFATAYGSCVWVTFVSSHVLSGALPKQQYGMVQSKIYPVYFKVMASTLGWSFLGHFLTRHHDKSSPSEKSHGYDLMASIGLVLVNLFFLEPLATKVMLDLMKQEKEEGRGTAAEPASVEGSRMVGEVEAEGSERQADGEVREEHRAQHQAQLERLNKRLKNLNTISAICNILTLVVLTSHLASLSYCLYASC